MLGSALLRLAAVAAREVWWKVVLKKVGEKVATEGARHIVGRLAQRRNDSLGNKLRRLDKMLKKNQVTKIEYRRLRPALIGASGAKDI